MASSPILDLGRHREQVFHPVDPGTGFLQVLHLVPDPLHRHPQQLHVGEDEIDRSDGEITRTEQALPHPVDESGAEGEDEDVGRPEGRPSGPGAQLIGEPGAEDPDEPAHEEWCGAVGPHLLGATEDLPDEAEELGAADSEPGPPWNGEMVDPERRKHRDGGENDHHQTDPETLDHEQHQDPDQKDDVADDMDGELREEVRQGGHVPVDPLDQLARSSLLVECEVEPDAMVGQVGAQFVRRRPPDPLPDPCGGQTEPLLSHRQDHEEHGETNQPGGIITCNRTIDDLRHQLRVDQLKGYPAGDQERKDDDPGPVWAEIVA